MDKKISKITWKLIQSNLPLWKEIKNNFMKDLFLQTIHSLCEFKEYCPDDWAVSVSSISEEYISLEISCHSDFFNQSELNELSSRFNFELPEVSGDWRKEFQVKIRNNQEPHFNAHSMNYIYHNWFN